jgi:hypothetical protein
MTLSTRLLAGVAGSTALALGLLAAPTPATADDPETPAATVTVQEDSAALAEAASGLPTTKAIFATPGNNAIRDQLAYNIVNAAPGSTIRAATAITNNLLALGLINAHRDRGVNVRLVLPGNTDRGCSAGASQALINALGTDQSKGSWVKCVQGSARNAPGSPGHMHIKAWTFTKVYTVEKVMIVTSSNTTDNGFATQYNDAYQTVGWTELFSAFNNSLFPELREDAGGGFWLRAWDAIEAYATPVSASADPVQIRIAGLPTTSRTKIDAAISVIERGTSNRATKIANELIKKRRAGGAVRVIYTRVSPSRPPAVTSMCAAGIQVREFDNDDELSRAYLHSKYMTASFVRDGSAKLRVWQGSEEWKTESLNQDEFVLRLASTSAYNSYTGNFNSLWGKATNSCA